MLKNKESFQNKYVNSNYLSSRSNWNEIVLSKIKVEKIGVIEDSYGIGLAAKSALTSNKGLIDKLKTKYNNIEVIKTNDVSSFLKKNGVKLVN
jgi:hypothetical protein